MKTTKQLITIMVAVLVLPFWIAGFIGGLARLAFSNGFTAAETLAIELTQEEV